MHSRRLFALARLGILLLAGLLIMGTIGCEEESDTPTDEIEEDPNLPPAVVDLPSAPPASAFVIPEKNADGTLRVEGVIGHQHKYLGEKVEITGHVFMLSEECDPAKAKKDETECPEPHLVIKDDRDATKQLLVVGYKQEFVQKAKLKPGEDRLFKGTYQKVAQGFVASEDGLLLVDTVDEHEAVEQK
ncbi:MAG: hypothetical protein ACNA8W_15890 [Bradymonadaceae bacterium]